MGATDEGLWNVPELRGARGIRPVTPVANPSFWAVEHDSAIVSREGSDVFTQRLHVEKGDLISWQRAVHAAKMAGAEGTAAPLVSADSGNLITVFEAWPASGRVATMSDLMDPESLLRIARVQAALHDGAPFGFELTVFDELDRLERVARELQVPLPADFDWMLESLDGTADVVRSLGRPKVACHRDTIASNVMLSPDRVWLCDFDRAADDDPLFDLAVLVSDAFTMDSEWDAALEFIGQPVDQAVLALLHLYAIADDLASALRAAIYAARSPRSIIEYSKYAGWRFLKARWGLRDRRYELWLRTLR